MSVIKDFLARRTGLSASVLDRLILTAPERYAVYRIPKKRGGFRTIAQPAYEIKELQYLMIEEVLSKLPIHHAATAYQKGHSIRLNAIRHVDNGPIRKYDFKDFFPSITEFAWLTFCQERELFSREDAIATGRLMFRRPKGGRILRLSIGAPTSPILSNILMYDFDRLVSERVARDGVTYSRYADDLVFSAPRTGHLTSIDRILRSCIREVRYPSLTINADKTVVATKRYRRQVTGIILTNDKRLSIGRDRKREIRAAVHHAINGKLDLKQTAELAGLLMFAKDVEPEFYVRMERSYGAEAISSIRLSVRTYRRTFEHRQKIDIETG